MGPIIRRPMIDTGTEVKIFAVQDPDYSFYSLDNKVDGLQRNEAPTFVFLQVFTIKANLKSKLILFTLYYRDIPSPIVKDSLLHVIPSFFVCFFAKNNNFVWKE